MNIIVEQIHGDTMFKFRDRYVAFRLPSKRWRTPEWRASVVKHSSYALWRATHEPPPKPDIRDPGFDYEASLRSESVRKGWFTRFRNEVGRAYQEFLVA